MKQHIAWLDGTTETREFVGGEKYRRDRVEKDGFYTDTAELVRKDATAFYFEQKSAPEFESWNQIEARSLRSTVRWLR